jgi:hypothetical protein
VHLNVSDDLLARDNNGQTACCINKYKSGGWVWGVFFFIKVVHCAV